MEPLSPNDPLLSLLEKARPVELRSNFSQNVMRAIRHTPQSVGLWERVLGWFREASVPRMALAGAAAVITGIITVASLQKPASTGPAVAEQAPAAVVQPMTAQPAIYHVSAAIILAATAEAAPAQAPVVDDMDPMRLLLVQGDTSALTDSELALLVY